MMAWCTPPLVHAVKHSQGERYKPLLCRMAGEGSWDLPEMGDGTVHEQILVLHLLKVLLTEAPYGCQPPVGVMGSWNGFG